MVLTSAMCVSSAFAEFAQWNRYCISPRVPCMSPHVPRMSSHVHPHVLSAHMYMSSCIHVHPHVCTPTCTRPHTCTCTPTCTCPHMYMYTHMYTSSHIHIYTSSHMYMYTHIYRPLVYWMMMWHVTSSRSSRLFGTRNVSYGEDNV